MQALKKEYVLINEIHDMLKKSRLRVCVSVWVERELEKESIFKRWESGCYFLFCFFLHTKKLKQINVNL